MNFTTLKWELTLWVFVSSYEAVEVMGYEIMSSGKGFVSVHLRNQSDKDSTCFERMNKWNLNRECATNAQVCH